MHLFLERCRRSNNVMVACFDVVRLFIFFLIFWTLQPHFTLWPNARTLQCLFVWRCACHNAFVLYLGLTSLGISVPLCSSVALLRSEIPSGMCAKLRTVAARNNTVHTTRSLYYCLFAPRICILLFFAHIPFVVNHTFNVTPPERLQPVADTGWFGGVDAISICNEPNASQGHIA